MAELTKAHLHVVDIARGGILLVGRDVQDGAGLEGDIGIARGVTRPDLRPLGVQGDGDLAALLDLLGRASIVDDGLWNASVSDSVLHTRQEPPKRLGRAMLGGAINS